MLIDYDHPDWGRCAGELLQVFHLDTGERRLLVQDAAP